MRLTKEIIKNSLEGCKRTFDVTLRGLTSEGIELLATVMVGELNTELESVPTSGEIARTKRINGRI